MTNKQIYIGLAVTSAVWTLLSAPVAVAEPYFMEGGTVQTTPAAMEGGGMYMDGGVQATQTYGASPSFVMEPLQAGTYCGDGVRQSGEACDGSDVPPTACQSAGFVGGNATCSGACTIVTTGCNSPAASSAAAQNPSQGNGANGGGTAGGAASSKKSSATPSSARTQDSETSLSFLPTFPVPQAAKSAPPRRPAAIARSSASLRPAAERSSSASSDASDPAASAAAVSDDESGDSSSRDGIGQMERDADDAPSVSSLAAMLGSESSSAGASAVLLSCIVFESAFSGLLARLYRLRKTYECLPAYAFSGDSPTA